MKSSQLIFLWSTSSVKILVNLMNNAHASLKDNISHVYIMISEFGSVHDSTTNYGPTGVNQRTSVSTSL